MDSKQDNNNKLQPMNEEQLPLELQWENMEAGIFQKMETLQAAVPSDKNKKHRRGLLLLACLLLAGVLMSTLFIFDYESAPENTTDFTSSPAETVERTDREETNGMTKTDQLPITITEQPTATEAKTIQTYTPKNNKQQNRITVEQSEENSYAEITVESLGTKAKYPQKTTTSSVAFEQITATKLENNVAPAMLNTDEKPTFSSPNSALLTPLDQLVGHKVTVPVVSQTSTKELALPIVSLPAKPTAKPQPAQLWLTGGASWWSPGYGDTKPERAEFEQVILSYQGQFSYFQPLKKNLVLLVGIQYQQLENRLNLNTQEDYELTLVDTVIQIQRNAITGATTEIRGDVTLTVPAERKVQHFNSFSLLQVPLGIGKTWGKGSWQSHLLVGGVANLSFAKQGRTLYQAELIDYNDVSSSIWTDKLSFSAMLRGGLSYRITDRLSVVTLVQYQRSLSNWSTEQGITMRPNILNWSLGVNYSGRK